jgi:anti-anti-sigma factor
VTRRASAMDNFPPESRIAVRRQGSTDTTRAPAGVRTRRSLESYRIEISGELTRTRAPALLEALEKALDRGAPRVVLDLTDVERIDHACLHTILVAHLRATDQRQQLLIVPGRESVRARLEAIAAPFQYADG